MIYIKKSLKKKNVFKNFNSFSIPKSIPNLRDFVLYFQVQRNRKVVTPNMCKTQTLMISSSSQLAFKRIVVRLSQLPCLSTYGSKYVCFVEVWPFHSIPSLFRHLISAHLTNLLLLLSLCFLAFSFIDSVVVVLPLNAVNCILARN